MIRRNRLNASYYCRYYYEQKLDNCCSVNIKEVDLTEVVKASISRQAALLGERAALLKLKREIQETKEKKLNLATRSFRKKFVSAKIKIFYYMRDIDRENWNKVSFRSYVKKV